VHVSGISAARLQGVECIYVANGTCCTSKLTISGLLTVILEVQCVQKVALHLGYVTWIWLSVSTLPLMCAVVSLYSVVKQQLKCNTGKVCNCLIQFLLTFTHFQHLL
jgi:hypothetical protein